MLPVRIEGCFIHGGAKALYESRWSGTINMAVVDKADSVMKVELRPGLKRLPSGLRCSWTPAGKQNLATGGIGICLAAAGIDDSQLNKWVKGYGGPNPALVVEFENMPDTAGCFTNKETVTGQVFVWDTSTKTGMYRRYCELVIPPNCLKLFEYQSAYNKTANAPQPDSAVLRKVSSQLWHSIISSGNEHIGLSKRAVGASSHNLTAFLDEQGGNEPESILKCLYNLIEELYIINVLSAKQLQPLITQLDEAAAAAEKAMLAGEIAALVRFQRSIQELASNGPIEPETAQLILEKSKTLLDSLSIRIEPVIAPQFVPVLPLEYKSWYVDCRHICPTPPDGSVEHPFPTIAAALQQAQLEALAGVSLFVSGGLYSDPLDITCDTTLVAMPHQLPIITETVRNNTASALSINGFYLVGAGPPAAISVYNTNAVTILNNVVIQDAEGFGIYQIGGEAQLQNVRITGTQTKPGSIWQGSGALFADGAQVTLTDLLSRSNESCGMVINGSGTSVTGTRVNIERNQFNRNWADVLVSAPLHYGTGALEVQNYAEAEFYNLAVRDNEIDGVLVHDGAVVYISDAVIERTCVFTPESGWSDTPRGGGIGARARRDGTLNITGFSISDCGLVGVVVGADGQVDLHVGQVFGHPVGVTVVPDPYDFNRLMDRVLYYDNARNLDTEALPLPDSTPALP